MRWRVALFGALVVLTVFLSLSAPHVARAEEASSTPGEVDPPKVDRDLGSIPPASTTDTDTQQRERESMSKSRKLGEKHEFQAEVSRLMDIIINSLYSNKDIFLRELISNASDALDKIRFLSLTDKSVLGEGEDTQLEIKIKLDEKNKILSIRDRGIGMTKEDLIKNLGTIAKSGTSAFLEQMQKGGDLNLIGQFGVGFYSVYLVADFVEVHSKHNDDTQWIWASKADGSYEIYEDDESEPLGRGTEIKIHLKDEASEYASEDKLKELVKKYSQFINFPISLWASKEVEYEVPDDSADEDEAEEVEEGDADKKEDEAEETEETEDEEEDDEKKPKTKTEKKTEYSWEVLNDVKAIWLRNPKDVSDEEYTKFFQSISKDITGKEPLSWSHFNAEGDVEFKAVLFIPPEAPSDLWENYYSSAAALKLYVRRVFISEDFDELLPRYLNFLKGIVDSDTLPLNVSREMLQQHGSLKTIKKKLVRKALDMIRRLAEEDEEDSSKKSSDGDDETKVETKSGKGKYATFWKDFGKSIKLGIIEDSSNRIRLAKLLRFSTSKSGEKLASLDDYVSRMKDGQKHIYYLIGQNKAQLEKSPFLEKLLKKGFEVIYFTDPVDEYLMQNLSEYDDIKFQNASKDDLKIGGKKDKAKEKELKESFKPLVGWWKDSVSKLFPDLENVKVSNRLAETPCVVVTSKYGWSANMERIMAAQALADNEKQGYMKSKKTLEINPRHPIIKELKVLAENNENDPAALEAARLLYETALLESGFVLDNPKPFASRVYSTLRSTLNIDPSAEVEQEEELPEDDNNEAKTAEAASNEEDIDPEDVLDEDEMPRLEEGVHEVKILTDEEMKDPKNVAKNKASMEVLKQAAAKYGVDEQLEKFQTAEDANADIPNEATGSSTATVPPTVAEGSSEAAAAAPAEAGVKDEL
eukprot:SM000078S22133  [mRNA]  locus=s78:558203:564628:- [translate_table: standard]